MTLASTVGERYDLATDAHDLTLRPGRCDADVLLAAGYAAAGNARGAQALALYRIRATGSRNGLAQIVDVAAGWMVDRRPQPGEKTLRLGAARDVSARVLLWWIDGVCPHCQGRRYELVPGTQMVSDNLCWACDGAGRLPVEDRVRREHQTAARWLAAEFDRMLAYVMADMARRLSPRLDL